MTCTTNFFSGTALSIPFAQGSISTRTDILPPGGSIHDQTTATLGASSPTLQGWAHASCTGPVQASVLYRSYSPAGTPVAEAGVNAETAPTTLFVTFAQTNTAVAYANPSTTLSALITFAVYSSSGAQLGSKTVSLNPQAHGASLVGSLLGLSNFTGFVKIVSSVPIISLSLNAEVTPLFSSLPPGDLPGSTTLVP